MRTTVLTRGLCTGLFSAAILSLPAFSASLVATYSFSGNLDAQQSGVPALSATDPLGQNAFVNDTVDGNARTVFAFNGNATPPIQQAGLTFNDSSNLIGPPSYSIELVFKFSDLNGWRRIVDVQNRQSDDGFYVAPGHQLSVYPTATGTTALSPNTYYDVILTDSGSTVVAYLNGSQEFSVNDPQMNLNRSNNPSQIMNLFLDNTVGGGIGEFSDGRIALFEAFDGVLTSSEAASLAADPFANAGPGSNVSPEPASWLLVIAGGAGFALLRRLLNS